MAGFMKNAMSYLGMSDVVDDEDDYIEEDEEQKPASKSAFDSDHTVTPLASTTCRIVDYQAVPRWSCEQNHHHPSEVI